MRSLVVALLVTLSAATARGQDRAVYVVDGDGALPRFDSLVIERRDPSGFRVRVEARSGSERLFAYELRGTRPWHRMASEASLVREYAVAIGDGSPRATFDRRTREVMLPRLPRESWLPRPLPDADWRDGWFDRGTFLGRALRRADDVVARAIEWAEPGRVELDEDVQIATSRDFRDDGTGRNRDGDWNWVPLREDDYLRMIDAGFNLFRARPRDLPLLMSQPVFLVAYQGLAGQPALPLLPGYRGAVMYCDEPAIRARRSDAFGRRSSPEEAAREVARQTRQALEGDTRYGRAFLAASLADQTVHWGGAPADRYPVWEAVGSAAWYELEAGASGWCFEARLDPDRFSRDVRRVTGVSLPASACLDLHLALFRGAARRFDAPWGVAIYGQADSAAAATLLPRAYDAGASYFWFWTSDGDHHVPHERQLRLAGELKEHVRAHPRPEGARGRTRSSRVALVLPWGYTFDDDTFARGGIWGTRQLAFDQPNGAGVAHRRVLAAAMRAARDLVARGETWDILFLRDHESPDGYAEVHRVTRGAVVHEWIR